MASEIKVDTIVNAGGDNDSGIDLATNDIVKVKTANSERMRVDASGNVGIGTASAADKLHVDGSGAFIRVNRTDGEAGITLMYNGSNSTRSNISNDTSGNLTIDTAHTEAMRIDSGQNVYIGSTGAIFGGSRFCVTETANDDVVQFENTNGSLSERVLLLNAHRSNASGYQFLLTYSGDGTDLEHNLRGDGNVEADGSISGGGADYAEYFEWKDGNTSDEDRVGISVKLDGDKIVASSNSDNASDIIGVISGNPAVVGDSAWNKWNKKYLRDDYGRYKRDENGERTLNPNYDKEKTYIAREDRKEWDVVGLMGKLRIKKGQKTGANWIKMRNVSDTVEEWLVR